MLLANFTKTFLKVSFLSILSLIRIWSWVQLLCLPATHGKHTVLPLSCWRQHRVSIYFFRWYLQSWWVFPLETTSTSLFTGKLAIWNKFLFCQTRSPLRTCLLGLRRLCLLKCRQWRKYPQFRRWKSRWERAFQATRLSITTGTWLASLVQDSARYFCAGNVSLVKLSSPSANDAAHASLLSSRHLRVTW